MLDVDRMIRRLLCYFGFHRWRTFYRETRYATSRHGLVTLIVPKPFEFCPDCKLEREP